MKIEDTTVGKYNVNEKMKECYPKNKEKKNKYYKKIKERKKVYGRNYYQSLSEEENKKNTRAWTKSLKEWTRKMQEKQCKIIKTKSFFFG